MKTFELIIDTRYLYRTQVVPVAEDMLELIKEERDGEFEDGEIPFDSEVFYCAPIEIAVLGIPLTYEDARVIVKDKASGQEVLNAGVNDLPCGSCGHETNGVWFAEEGEGRDGVWAIRTERFSAVAFKLGEFEADEFKPWLLQYQEFEAMGEELFYKLFYDGKLIEPVASDPEEAGACQLGLYTDQFFQDDNFWSRDGWAELEEHMLLNIHTADADEWESKENWEERQR